MIAYWSFFFSLYFEHESLNIHSFFNKYFFNVNKYFFKTQNFEWIYNYTFCYVKILNKYNLELNYNFLYSLDTLILYKIWHRVTLTALGFTPQKSEKIEGVRVIFPQLLCYMSLCYISIVLWFQFFLLLILMKLLWVKSICRCNK